MSDEEKTVIAPEWIKPQTVEREVAVDDAPIPKSKRTRRTKAQMAEAEIRGESPRRGVVRNVIPVASLVSVSIESFPPPPMVPSLSPEAKRKIVPETSIRAFLVWWLIIGVWFEPRAVKFCVPFLCIKITY